MKPKDIHSFRNVSFQILLLILIFLLIFSLFLFYSLYFYRIEVCPRVGRKTSLQNANGENGRFCESSKSFELLSLDDGLVRLSGVLSTGEGGKLDSKMATLC